MPRKEECRNDPRHTTGDELRWVHARWAEWRRKHGERRAREMMSALLPNVRTREFDAGVDRAAVVRSVESYAGVA